MWTYDKKLQYPVNIKQTNSKLAKAIITQYGGPDGELGASLRYLSQRISKAGFALNDLALFLNTHPSSVQAFRQYEFYQKKHEELTREYENRYGPLTRKITSNSDRWTWIDGPWPWEREYNEEI